MKRFFAVLIVLFSLVYANPIFTIDAYLSELTFEEDGSWHLELFYDFFDSYGAFPWFFKYSLETNDGRSDVLFHDSTLEYFEITNDNLNKDLFIDQTADSLKLIAHDGNPNDPYFIDYLVIGEESGSYIMNIDNGQSVSRLLADYWSMYTYKLFYKSDSATIGAENDTSRAKGRIFGYAYSYDGTALGNRIIWINDCMGSNMQIETDEQGYYCSRILARSYVIDSLWVSNPSERSGENMVFKALYFDLEPDDNKRVDFYQLETAIVPVIKNDIVKVNNYPHPASSYTWLFIDNTDVEASAMRVNVYALNGRKVDSFIPTAKEFRYDCSHLPQGSYVMSLQLGSEVLATKKLQILK